MRNQTGFEGAMVAVMQGQFAIGFWLKRCNHCSRLDKWRGLVDNFVFVAVLAASLLHASWHALIKSTVDRVISLAGMNIVSGVISLALLPLTKPLPTVGFWVIAGSVFLHFSYKLTLARLYHVADFGQAYPLARGLTPIAATTLAFLVFGELPNTLAIIGIGLVCGGLALLAFERCGERISAFTFYVALATGLTVACYSVVDAYGIRITGDVFSFTIWLMLLDSSLFVAYAFATRREQVLTGWIGGWRRVLASGGFGLISFGVFMWALGRAPVGAVSALRETSVLLAAIIGAVFLGERAGWMRYGAAAAVAAGVGIIGLAR